MSASTTPADPRRVAEIHRQTRRSLRLAAGFVLVAPIAAVVPHATGAWLPLHLFLVGGLLGAISVVTQLLAVSWSASPAPPPKMAGAQRWLLALGAGTVALGRELPARALVVAGGSAVIIALLVLGANLVRIRSRATNDRFHPAIDAYILAVTAGVAGTPIGIALAVGGAGSDSGMLRDAHLTLNLFGLVGIVIVGTLPYLIATQARTKMSSRATPRRLRTLTIGLGVATAVTVAGYLTGRPGVAAAGLGAYALGVAATLLLLPMLRRRQLAWAGPRLLQLGTGVAWWVVTTVILAVEVLAELPDRGGVLRAMAIGGFAQILLASLAYFGPVLRGGGHERLSAGFALTRSWPSLFAANTAAAGALTDHTPLMATGLAVWTAEVAARAGRFAGQSTGPPR